MSAPALVVAVNLLVALWVAVFFWHRVQRRRLAAWRAELAGLHAMLAQAQTLAVSRRGSDGRKDERAEREYQRLMAEYDARYERLRADCDKHGLHLPARPWRQR